MNKTSLYTAVFSVLIVLEGCTSPELSMPSVFANKPKTTTQDTPKSKPCKNETRTYYPPTPQKQTVFNKEMRRVALSTQNDPRYNRMSLDTPEKKAWFKQLMYRLWDRQITRDEFIAQGIKKYPTHRYEFEFIANGFQKQ